MTWEYCWQKDWENENENKTESRLSDEFYQKERTAERQNGQKCLSCGGRACGISNGHLAKRIDEHNWERWERAIEQLNKLRLTNKWMNQLNWVTALNLKKLNEWIDWWWSKEESGSTDRWRRLELWRWWWWSDNQMTIGGQWIRQFASVNPETAQN